jgi:hypothetical protein
LITSVSAVGQLEAHRPRLRRARSRRGEPCASSTAASSRRARFEGADAVSTPAQARRAVGDGDARQAPLAVARDIVVQSG